VDQAIGNAAARTALSGPVTHGPAGQQQKLMAMGMSDGFGADADFGAPGAYTVKTKAVAGGSTLLDQFTYDVN